jgi:K+-transporting ATPase ATPase A chain
MTIIFVGATIATMTFEQQGNPRIAALGVDMQASDMQSGGNMEGKETRYGIGSSALWGTASTATSNGSVISMHDSFTPLGGLVPLWMIELGEVVFGGVGSGLYGMLMVVIIAVFIGGLMIGRTPEYLGKKIETFDMKIVTIAILTPPMLALLGTAIAVMTGGGTATIYNPGAHGFSEVLYAFSSAAFNNGSAFAGLGANTPFYNGLLGMAIWFGRFAVIVPVLALAGSLAAKKPLAHGSGTLPTHAPLFVVMSIGTVLLLGALTFIPALAIGPIAEHFVLWPR